jgi:lysozyme family protein
MHETGGDLERGAPHLDAEDPGGFTKWGISSRAFPELDVAALSREAAEALYREHYWDVLRCAEMPTAVALAVFDYAVPSGVPRAARALQRVVGARVDGRVGGRTLAALAARIERDSILDVVSELCMERASFLVALSLARARDASDAAGLQLAAPHARGWLRRLAHTAALAGWLAREAEQEGRR